MGSSHVCPTRPKKDPPTCVRIKGGVKINVETKRRNNRLVLRADQRCEFHLLKNKGAVNVFPPLYFISEMNARACEGGTGGAVTSYERKIGRGRGRGYRREGGESLGVDTGVRVQHCGSCSKC